MTTRATIQITPWQAKNFLKSLWPAGEMSHLATHPRTFLEALIPEVPKTVNVGSAANVRALANVLMGLAARLNEAADRAEDGRGDIDDEMPF